MYENVDAVLVAQLEQFCEFWSDLPLIFRPIKTLVSMRSLRLVTLPVFAYAVVYIDTIAAVQSQNVL